MIREILLWPHPLLKTVAKEVVPVDTKTRELIADMFETMYAADGVGLAATQLGVLHRVLVLDTSPKQPETKPLAMVNPEILSSEGTQIYREGCLSIPGESEDVERAAVVTVRYFDERGTSQLMTADQVLAVAVQHEVDHLNGIMFVDHLSPLKRDLIRRRMKKVKATSAEEAKSEMHAKPSAKREGVRTF